MVIRRGDLHWVDFGPVVDSAPAKRRPAVVVSHDRFNRSRIRTVLVVGITSNTQRAENPGNVFLPVAASGLPKDSVVNVTQVSATDKSRVGDRIGSLPAYLLDEVDAGLRLVLDL